MAALFERLAHRGQAEIGSDLDVVEADHRQLSGNRDSERPRRLENADRLGVGRGEDRRGAIRQGKKFGRDRTCDVGQTRSLPDVVLAQLDPRRGQGALVAARAVATPVEAELRRRVADQGDAAVAEV